jgi:hypothetical protein
MELSRVCENLSKETRNWINHNRKRAALILTAGSILVATAAYCGGNAPVIKAQDIINPEASVTLQPPPTKTHTPTPIEGTQLPTETATATATETLTPTPIETVTATIDRTPIFITLVPTKTPTATEIGIATNTPTPTMTETPEPTGTATPFGTPQVCWGMNSNELNTIINSNQVNAAESDYSQVPQTIKLNETSNNPDVLRELHYLFDQQGLTEKILNSDHNVQLIFMDSGINFETIKNTYGIEKFPLNNICNFYGDSSNIDQDPELTPDEHPYSLLSAFAEVIPKEVIESGKLKIDYIRVRRENAGFSQSALILALHRSLLNPDNPPEKNSVVVLSLGGLSYNETMKKTLTEISQKQGVNFQIILSAGNEGMPGLVTYPGKYIEEVPGLKMEPIGASYNGDKDYYSNYGPRIKDYAPARWNVILNKQGEIGLRAGTSIAAPVWASLYSMFNLANPITTTVETINNQIRQYGTPLNYDYSGNKDTIGTYPDPCKVDSTAPEFYANGYPKCNRIFLPLISNSAANAAIQ